MTFKDNYDLGLMLKPNYSKILHNSEEEWGTIDAEEFTHQLEFGIYTYANLLVRDMGVDPIAVSTAIHAMENIGLPNFIASLSEVYSESLQEQVFVLPSGLHPDIAQFVRWLQKANLKPEDWRVACCFLKRFTVSSELLRKSCLFKFCVTDSRNFVLDSVNPSNFRYNLDRRAKEYITWLVGDFTEFVEYARKRILTYDLPITSHAVSIGCKKPYHRYVLALVGAVDFLNHVYWDDNFVAHWSKDPAEGVTDYPTSLRRMIPVSRIVATMQPAWNRFSPFYQEVNVSAVPKDVSKYRIVSPEVPGRLAIQKIFNDYIKERIFARGMERNLPLWSQEVMRELCLNSVRGDVEYATIDESSASDTVRKTHIRSLFSTDWAEFLVAFSPKRFTIPKDKKHKHVVLNMFAPMGSADTLLMESLVFWAYDCASVDYASAFIPGSKKKLGRQRRLGNVVIYPHSCYAMGDDQQIPTFAAETVLEIQQLLGFMPNVEKSFYDEDHLFRESCGVEYLNLDGEVININNPYFPRRVIQFDSCAKGPEKYLPKTSDFRWDHTGESTGEWNNSLTSIISLAKRLYEAGYSVTSELIQRWIYLNFAGYVTSSPVGSQTSDLWLGELTRSNVTIPMGSIISVQRERYGYSLKEIVSNAEKITISRERDVTVKPIHYGRFLLAWREKPASDEWDRGLHWSVSSKKMRLVIGDRDEESDCPICKYERNSIFIEAEKEFFNFVFYMAALRKPYTPDVWIDPRDQYLIITEPEIGTTF